MRLRYLAFAASVLVVAALVQAPALAAPGSAAGRRHAAKANKLAAQNRCKAALPEFTKAYRLLKDPALLFNRAECYRKVGKDSQALKDYEAFLAEMPAAPNRSTVEARIASLRGDARAVVPPRKDLSTKPGTKKSTPDEYSAVKWEDSSPTPVGEQAAVGVGSTAFGTAAPVAPKPKAAAGLTMQPVVPEPKQAGASKAWIWVGAAVVVVGAGAFAAYRYWPQPKTDVPQTPLGNYAF